MFLRVAAFVVGDIFLGGFVALATKNYQFGMMVFVGIALVAAGVILQIEDTINTKIDEAEDRINKKI